MTEFVQWQGKQLDLIRRTVAKDCNPAEFDQFIHICKHARLDPLRRQIYCFVFHKNDDAKRQMTVVTSIGGYRSIAERTGTYRPDGQAPRYDRCPSNERTNPLGIERCEVTVYKHSHGEWHPVVGEAWWDEYVPLFNGEIDKKKTGWVKMPRIMIAKCAEANALRKAWPDDFAALVTEEEIDRAHSLNMTASELADDAAAEAKMALVGGKDALTVMWDHGARLELVPAGRFCDAALAWAKANDRTSTEIDIWWNTNLPARTAYKARHGAEYLEFQKEWQAVKNCVESEEANQDTPALEAAE